MLLDDQIYARFQALLDELADAGREEITQQGHVATGRGRDSLEGQIVSKNLAKLEGAIMAADYMVGPVNDGVKASRVPFGGGRSRGGKSKYIQGLVTWLRTIKPSLSDQERLSMAFAIGRTAKREGHPTRGSYAFSRNGARTSWIRRGLEINAEEIERRLRLFALVRGSYEQELVNASMS
jgi:hypothetical protein